MRPENKLYIVTFSLILTKELPLYLLNAEVEQLIESLWQSFTAMILSHGGRLQPIIDGLEEQNGNLINCSTSLNPYLAQYQSRPLVIPPKILESSKSDQDSILITEIRDLLQNTLSEFLSLNKNLLVFFPYLEIVVQEVVLSVVSCIHENRYNYHLYTKNKGSEHLLFIPVLPSSPQHYQLLVELITNLDTEPEDNPSLQSWTEIVKQVTNMLTTQIPNLDIQNIRQEGYEIWIDTLTGLDTIIEVD